MECAEHGEHEVQRFYKLDREGAGTCPKFHYVDPPLTV